MSALDKRLAEIRERAEKATGGPWSRTGTSVERIEIASYSSEPGHRHVALCIPYNARREENAAFIAASRTDIPFLLAQLKIAVGALEELEQLERGHEVYIIGTSNEPRAHRVARESLAAIEKAAGGHEKGLDKSNPSLS